MINYRKNVIGAMDECTLSSKIIFNLYALLDTNDAFKIISCNLDRIDL